MAKASPSPVESLTWKCTLYCAMALMLIRAVITAINTNFFIRLIGNIWVAKNGATPLKAVHCAFVAPFHILDAKVRQKVARGKKKCAKKSQRVNESTGFGADGGGGGALFSDPADPSDPSVPSLV